LRRYIYPQGEFTRTIDIVRILPVWTVFLIFHFSDEEERTWFWKYLDNEMYMDAAQDIRLRVVAIEYHNAVVSDPSISIPKLMSDLKPAMKIVGTAAEDGLGMVQWWQPSGDEASA
jgi:DNA-directed RNA polymerase subunit E'/Rpb7